MREIDKVAWDRYKVTIIMANYNKEEYIVQSIESVLMQETNFEYLLAIVDDCSTDGSPEIIRKYEAMYPEKILVVRSKQNGGYYKSQLEVYPYMKSDYYTLLDPDDYWTSKHLLQDAVSFLEENKDFSACGFNTQFVKNEEVEEELFCPTDREEIIHNSIQDYFENRYMMSHTSATIYRNVVYQNGVPKILMDAKESMAEASFRGDTDRFIMTLKYGKIKFINKIVSAYRVYDGGIWSGASMVTQCLMRARAQCDYSDFYEAKYEQQFMDKIKVDLLRIVNSVVNESYSRNCREKDIEKDINNYNYIMERMATKMTPAITQEEIQRLWKFINEYDGEPIIIWGCGGTAETFLDNWNIPNIKYFVDSNLEKQEKIYRGVDVKAPEDIEDGCYVMIMNIYGEEIKEFIIKNNICNIDFVLDVYGFMRL